MHVVCKWLMVKWLKSSRASRCPVACCKSSLMYFSVGTLSHSRIVNRQQLQIFSMPNISRVSATHRRYPQITSLIIHTARLSLAWMSTDLPPMSGICRRFFKTCRWVKSKKNKCSGIFYLVLRPLLTECEMFTCVLSYSSFFPIKMNATDAKTENQTWSEFFCDGWKY